MSVIYINSYSFAATDPNFANVSLLLHGDGTNGSTTITDSSPSPKTVTASGNAQISTAESKFGGASIAFDGTGDYLSIPRNAAFLPVANEDFTIEAWVYLNAPPGATDAQIVGHGEYGLDSDWLFMINSSRQVYFYFSSTFLTCLNTAVLSLNTWHHVAASRSGTGSSNMKVFVNGVGASFTTNVTTIGTGNRNLTIGADQDGDESNLNGYIDDIRITKGVGRYTANFTPPTAPFPDA
jgi:hypothetical protein